MTAMGRGMARLWGNHGVSSKGEKDSLASDAVTLYGAYAQKK